MFGKRKESELPVVDIRYKVVKGLFGRTKKVATTKKEQREIKKRLLQQNPKLKFIDDLNEHNSAKADGLAWIDRVEEFDAMMD